MARHVPPPFPQGSVEEVTKIVGDLYSGSDLTRILHQVGLPAPLESTMTKWRRLAAAMQEKQATKQDGGAVIGLIHAAMAPDRTLSRRAEAAVARDNLNQVLSISGYRVKDDGRVTTTPRATTDSEAFRNPAAYAPKIVWTITEQDALDVLGTLSMVHRRLYAARLCQR